MYRPIPPSRLAIRSGLYTLILACLLGLACAEAEPGTEAERLARRVINAYGGKAIWDNLRGARFVETTRRFDSQSSTVAIHYMRKNSQTGWSWRWEQPKGRQSVIQGIDGGTGWVLVNGRPDVSPAAVTRAQEACWSQFYWFGLPFVLDSPEVNLRLPDQSSDAASMDTTVIRLEATFKTPQAGRPADGYLFYIDRQTFLINVVQYWQGGRRKEATTVLWQDHRITDGLVKAFRWIYVDDRRNLVFKTELSELELNPGLNPNLFKKPPPL